ncbi:MAG: NAD(P)H-dependent oxidoreductase [Deltaproteobacteria bacterium]|nr:NAD(P)H-dependent oxidoreductase [Deltaproteobacteria bacterium]
MKPQLHVVVVSTRPARKGPALARWLVDRARAHGRFEVTLVDLREEDLPLLDEANHPRLAQYEHAHTRAWSAKVAGADAFVFVTPEYNYGVPAPLVNALDYLFHEWHYKAAGFLSYGGVSGGLRAVQMAKQLVTALRMMPIPEGVSVPMFAQLIDDSGAFAASELHERSATAMLDELFKWTTALSPLRASSPARA